LSSVTLRYAKSMKEPEKLDLLIDRLEAYARRQPGLYRLRVALLAALGYAYLIAVVALLLLIVYLMLFHVRWSGFTIKIIWIPLVLVGLVARSLWITIPDPDGKELNRQQAPRLFEAVQQVEQALAGPQVDRILLSDEFNAAIVQIPRFGMFGWLRNYLVIGLPLMHALSPKEFRAVLAHEFGHLSGNHGRFSGWVYRVRASWIQILERVHEERHYASFIFVPFLNWYAPFFNAYSFVLARRQEYEADSYSVKLVGRDVAARSLIRLSTAQHSLEEEFWPAFFRRAHAEPKAPQDPFSQILLGVGQSTSSARARKWFWDELKTRTGHDDTHPALADRLEALGFSRDNFEKDNITKLLVETNGESSGNAAEYYLRELPEDLIAGYDRLWREQITKPWRERHDNFQQTRRRLTELQDKENSDTLTLDEQMERVRALREVSESDAALPLLRRILQENPDHAEANFSLGALLLEQNDSSGIEYLKKTLKSMPWTAEEALKQISNFHLEHGRPDEALLYRNRAEQHRKQIEEALSFSPDDSFEPHRLTPEQVKVLREQLEKVRGLSRAYLVRKIPKAGGEQFHVLGVVAGYTWQEGQSTKNYGALLDELSARVEFSVLTVLVSLDQDRKYLAGIFSQIKDAEVFSSIDPEDVEYFL